MTDDFIASSRAEIRFYTFLLSDTIQTADQQTPTCQRTVAIKFRLGVPSGALISDLVSRAPLLSSLVVGRAPQGSLSPNRLSPALRGAIMRASYLRDLTLDSIHESPAYQDFISLLNLPELRFLHVSCIHVYPDIPLCFSRSHEITSSIEHLSLGEISELPGLSSPTNWDELAVRLAIEDAKFPHLARLDLFQFPHTDIFLQRFGHCLRVLMFNGNTDSPSLHKVADYCPSLKSLIILHDGTVPRLPRSHPTLESAVVLTRGWKEVRAQEVAESTFEKLHALSLWAPRLREVLIPESPSFTFPSGYLTPTVEKWNAIPRCREVAVRSFIDDSAFISPAFVSQSPP